MGKGDVGGKRGVMVWRELPLRRRRAGWVVIGGTA